MAILICNDCRFHFEDKWSTNHKCCIEPQTTDRFPSMTACHRFEPEFCSDPELKKQYDKFMFGIHLQKE